MFETRPYDIMAQAVENGKNIKKHIRNHTGISPEHKNFMYLEINTYLNQILHHLENNGKGTGNL